MKAHKILLIFCILFFYSNVNAEYSINLNQIVKNGEKTFEKNLDFIQKESRIAFFKENATSKYGHVNLTGILFPHNNEKILLSVYENDAGVPFVGEALLFDVDGDGGNELLVTIKRKTVVRAENINAVNYKIYIYDDVLKTRKGVKRLLLLKNAMKEFGEGDDGVFHGEEVSYKYKTKASIINKLEKIRDAARLDEVKFFHTVVEKSYEESLRNYKKGKYPLSMSILDKVFQKRDIRTKYPEKYRKRYMGILNDYAFFIFKYYEEKAQEYCKYIDFSSKEERSQFRLRTLNKSKDVLEYVLSASPKRVVAYLNIADVFYELDSDAEAEKMYKRYIELMKSKGKYNKIPLRAKHASKRVKIHLCK